VTIFKRFVLVVLLLGLLGVGVGVGVSSASAETLTPWFHLNSTSRPANLGAEPPHSEEQELVAKPGQSGEGAVFRLLVGKQPAGVVPGYAVEGYFEAEPYPSEFGGLAPLASRENVQASLEAVYGKGNVIVEGGPAGVEPLIVKSAGEDTDRPVPQIEVENVVGKTSSAVVSPGKPDGVLVATAINLGDATSGEGVTVTGRLPEHFSAVSAEGNAINQGEIDRGPVACEVTAPRDVRCTLRKGASNPAEEVGTLAPYEQIEVAIGVNLEAGAASGEQNQVSVAGGGAPAATISRPVKLAGEAGEATPFGAEVYELTPEEPGGVADVQAGSHPFQLTTTFDLNQNGRAEPAGLVKDLTFRLPPGLVGNPDAYPRCALGQFLAVTEIAGRQNNLCPSDSVLGVAVVTYRFSPEGHLEHASLPLFNLEPSPGEAARFGFLPATGPVFLSASVRTGEDYGVTVHVANILQTVGFTTNSVTFWGVPGDSRHDDARGYTCLEEASEAIAEPSCHQPEESSPQPFLDMPTSCPGAPLATEVSADSWAAPSVQVSPSPNPSVPMPRMSGCGLLPFGSQINVSADEETASSPSGLKVDVHVPQEEALNPQGLAPANLKDIVVALPEGVVLNPSAADGLTACTQEQVGLHNGGEPSCPDTSKIATVAIHTPLLPNPLSGFVYLAAPQNFRSGPLENPFGSLIAMYLVARDPVSGVLVKLAGEVSLSATGQITATFAENPQLPFEDAELEFFGGERAPLATPAHCGSYTTNALFEPWTNGGAVDEVLHSSSFFPIAAGPNGSPCPGVALPFSPTLASEATDVNAGGFTPLSTTLSREDGQQNISSVTLHYPPGLSGLLTGVTLCPEAQANDGTCPQSSEIGETIVSVGLGGDPFTVTGGKVYLTEHYDGAPFGLSITDPPKAGPFDLQEGRLVVVRAKVDVDPHTAALTVTTDPPGSPHAIPTILEGIPLAIKHVNVLVNRPGFTFDPTSCEKLKIEGAIQSAEGASSPVSVPFQVTNCAALQFAPKFAVSTSGKPSRLDGTSLSVKLTYPSAPFGSQANISQVKVELPKQLPSRLPTLQKACTAAQFDANPAGCPMASIVGHARAITPLVPVPLEGPAYFVSNGGEAFPNLIVVLQGYGVTIDLVGDTFISKKGVTSSTFKTVPDAPVGSFELNLPAGPYSALTADGNPCKQTLAMPTEFVAQNGARIQQSTKIEVQGCGKAKKTHHQRKKHNRKKTTKRKKKK
jgi:hypothetical protein